MGAIGDLIESVYPAVLSVVKNFADSYVDGAELGKDMKQALYAGYVAINLYGDDLVESTENEFDNGALEALSEFCKDTLDEAGITVPEIPDELLEFEPPEAEG